MKAIVTKEWMAAKIAANPQLVIGRALVAILKNQTAEEQAIQATKFHNGVGFAKPDANLGTRCARTYLAKGKLEDWQLKLWLLPNKKGEPRIVKYTNQLNKIANEKC